MSTLEIILELTKDALAANSLRIPVYGSIYMLTGAALHERNDFTQISVFIALTIIFMVVDTVWQDRELDKIRERLEWRIADRILKHRQE